jgi:transposase
VVPDSHLSVHLAVDGRGLPMSVILTPGQAGDNPQLLPLLDQVAVGRDGPGRPRARPDRLLADKTYSHLPTRTALRERGIAFTCPESIDQIARRRAKGSGGGRPPCGCRERGHVVRPVRTRVGGHRAGFVAAVGRLHRRVGECGLLAGASIARVAQRAANPGVRWVRRKPREGARPVMSCPHPVGCAR